MGNLATESELGEFEIEQTNLSVDFVPDFRHLLCLVGGC